MIFVAAGPSNASRTFPAPTRETVITVSPTSTLSPHFLLSTKAICVSFRGKFNSATVAVLRPGGRGRV
jgi:hypothetical protein